MISEIDSRMFFFVSVQNKKIISHTKIANSRLSKNLFMFDIYCE